MKKDWQLELNRRWAAVRAKGSVLGWQSPGSPYISDLASKCGVLWYESRSQDRVEEFMAYDEHGLFTRLHGFGRIKCQRLIEILEAASAEINVPNLAEEDCGRAFTLTCADMLHLWGVPPAYPLHLLPLSTRLMNFCESQKIDTLPMLFEVWATIGRGGLLAHENIGRRTVDELQSLANAVSNADAIAVRRWLPLNDAENGLCLRRALALGFGMLPPSVVVILTRRLVDQLTLEEIGVEHGLTRERVRQYEAAYLRDIRAILDWFSNEYLGMLEAWMECRDWQIHVTPQASPEATTLILAGIEACFADSPQGVARRLSAEATMLGWMEALMSHSDLYLGGVELQDFLNAIVPAERQPEFITELTSKRGVFIDHVSGLVQPVAPCVRDTLCAILDLEVAPIPLTWLAQRVQAIQGCEEGDADFIRRNRYRWSQLGFLDLSKVLWNE